MYHYSDMIITLIFIQRLIASIEHNEQQEHKLIVLLILFRSGILFIFL